MAAVVSTPAAVLAEVGKFYMVPCVKVRPGARTSWIASTGWVPVLGMKHRDAEHLDFPHEHYHVDWRFVGDKQYAAVLRKPSGLPHGSVLTDTEGDFRNPSIRQPVVMRRLKCRRDMPDFPEVRKIVAGMEYHGDSGAKWERLERAQAIVCNKLKPGNICPHRGIDLTPFVKPDGTVICPGHGLRWDTHTGDLLPYQASAA